MNQQNSTLVEESAASAKTLETQAATMAEQVDFFRIDADDSDTVVQLAAASAARGNRKLLPSQVHT
jgi:hypothetical protein